jgi:hypothetical protein
MQCTSDIDIAHNKSSSGKARLLSLHDIDRRTAAYQKTVALITAIEADLGGSDRISTGERQIVQRAALTGALVEDLETRWLQGQPIDPAVYCTLANCQRRLLETVGLRRVPREVVPSPLQYLAAQAVANATQTPAESISPTSAISKSDDAENEACGLLNGEAA